jgi:hypothetical protein
MTTTSGTPRFEDTWCQSNSRPLGLQETECSLEEYAICERYIHAQVLEGLDRWRAKTSD